MLNEHYYTFKGSKVVSVTDSLMTMSPIIYCTVTTVEPKPFPKMGKILHAGFMCGTLVDFSYTKFSSLDRSTCKGNKVQLEYGTRGASKNKIHLISQRTHRQS